MTLHKEPLDQEDQDAIIFDARAGDLESLKEIFTTLIDPCMLYTCRDSTSQSSALHMACGNGHLDTVKYILSFVPKDELKAFVNLENETGNTALHWASLNGHLDIVQLLCDEYDADPFIRNSFGHDAIFEAENNGKEDVENYFLKKYDVEPESDNEEEDSEATVDNVQVSRGTEIENVTKEATDVLREATEKLNIE
ncbi:ankyrin repeat-containing protein Yar1p [Monosporozyma servazzii]